MSSFYHQSRASEVYGGTITLTIVATVAVALRFVSRRISQAPYWFDDWAIIVALVSRTDFYTYLLHDANKRQDPLLWPRVLLLADDPKLWPWTTLVWCRRANRPGDHCGLLQGQKQNWARILAWTVWLSI